MWQLSGVHGHTPDRERALTDMQLLVDAGFTTFDLADHYGHAGEYVGEFLRRRTASETCAAAGSGACAAQFSFHTKWVLRRS